MSLVLHYRWSNFITVKRSVKGIHWYYIVNMAQKNHSDTNMEKDTVSPESLQSPKASEVDNSYVSVDDFQSPADSEEFFSPKASDFHSPQDIDEFMSPMQSSFAPRSRRKRKPQTSKAVGKLPEGDGLPKDN